MFVYVIILIRLAIALVKQFVNDVIVQYSPGIKRPIMQLRQGKVQGATDRLPNGQLYSYYKGIPYAKPPVGELRFRPPVPLDRFDKPVLKCLIDKTDFIQPHALFKSFVTGSEDALYLNVYSPAVSDSEENKFPVMVYIHGGGFEHGTASSFVYNPQYMVMQGVVIVTLFYRLGPFGFLCLPSAEVYGNFGLKDQVRKLLQKIP